MIRIATTYHNNTISTIPSGSPQILNLSEQSELDILCCQIKQKKNKDSQSALRNLASSLHMSCSSIVLTSSQDNDQSETIFSMLTGESVWMLNSGSIALPTSKKAKHRVQFGLVRKGSTAVLIINMQYIDLRRERLATLHALFSHQLFKEQQYGVVLICTERAFHLSKKEAAQLTAGTGFVLHRSLQAEKAKSKGALLLFVPQDQSAAGMLFGRQGDYSLVACGAAAGDALLLEFQVQAVVRNKRKRPRFPLSFAEQWAGYKENLRPTIM
ncbi:MAG: hypothetical protein HQQ73_04920 [Desulfobulbaceae bacterium]|nr:hypothetical protein [Desulfobulbaceae bacterium]